jgi:hypothetical protein
VSPQIAQYYHPIVLTVDRVSWCGEYQLVEAEVEPLAKFESGLVEGAGVGEAEFLVEGDAGGVGHVDRADHGVIFLGLGSGDELLEERSA